MARDLTNLYISESFNHLLQISGSDVQTGVGQPVTGSLTVPINITVASASYALSASYEIIKEVSSSYADFAKSASYAANGGDWDGQYNNNAPVLISSSLIQLRAGDVEVYGDSTAPSLRVYAQGGSNTAVRALTYGTGSGGYPIAFQAINVTDGNVVTLGIQFDATDTGSIKPTWYMDSNGNGSKIISEDFFDIDILNGDPLTINAPVILSNGATGSLFGTASHAIYAETAAFATDALDAVTAQAAISASHALVADTALTAGTSQYSDNTIVYGKNLSGAEIPKGTPLYFTGSGTSGNIVGVYPADAGNPARMPAAGVAGETLAIEAEGVVLLDGFINGVDTTGFQSGQQVYVGVGGGYQATRPTGSNNLVQGLGYIEKVAVNGSGVIRGAGRTNDVPNIEQGYVWVGGPGDVATTIPTSSLTTEWDGTFTGDASITGSLTVSGSFDVTGVDNLGSNNLSVTDTYGVEVLKVQGLPSNKRFASMYISGGVEINLPTFQSRFQVTGGSGTTIIAGGNIGSSDSTEQYSAGINGGSGGVLQVTDNVNSNDFGIAGQMEQWGYLGDWTGPGIWSNDPGGNYPTIVGFQNSSTWTDGRVTFLTPISASAGIVGNITNATTASYVGDALYTASASANVLTFIKGDGTSFNVNIAQSGSVESASYASVAEALTPGNKNITGDLTATGTVFDTVDLSAVSGIVSQTTITGVTGSNNEPLPDSYTGFYNFGTDKGYLIQIGDFAKNINSRYVATPITQGFLLNPSGSTKTSSFFLTDTGAKGEIFFTAEQITLGAGISELVLVEGNNFKVATSASVFSGSVDISGSLGVDGDVTATGTVRDQISYPGVGNLNQIHTINNVIDANGTSYGTAFEGYANFGNINNQGHLRVYTNGPTNFSSAWHGPQNHVWLLRPSGSASQGTLSLTETAVAGETQVVLSANYQYMGTAATDIIDVIAQRNPNSFVKFDSPNYIFTSSIQPGESVTKFQSDRTEFSGSVSFQNPITGSIQSAVTLTDGDKTFSGSLNIVHDGGPERTVFKAGNDESGSVEFICGIAGGGGGYPSITMRGETSQFQGDGNFFFDNAFLKTTTSNTGMFFFAPSGSNASYTPFLFNNQKYRFGSSGRGFLFTPAPGSGKTFNAGFDEDYGVNLYNSSFTKDTGFALDLDSVTSSGRNKIGFYTYGGGAYQDLFSWQDDTNYTDGAIDFHQPISASAGIVGSLTGTATNATSASYAVSSSISNQVTNNNTSSGSLGFWQGSQAEYDLISGSASNDIIYFIV